MEFLLRIILLATFIFFPLLAQSDNEVYRWTDSNGNVHYSDQPKEGATAVPLPPDQSYSTPNNSGSAPTNPNATPPDDTSVSSTDQSTGDTHVYRNLRITSPTDQYTSVNNPDGGIQVSIDVQPSLQEGDKVQVLVDGRQGGSPQPTSSITVTGIERGQHILQAQILDKNGKVLVTSNKVTIFMQRVIIEGNKPGAPLPVTPPK